MRPTNRTRRKWWEDVFYFKFTSEASRAVTLGERTQRSAGYSQHQLVHVMLVQHGEEKERSKGRQKVNCTLRFIGNSNMREKKSFADAKK